MIFWSLDKLKIFLPIKVLGQHYGFTDEELDFIISYTIKYRMGREGADNDAGTWTSL